MTFSYSGKTKPIQPSSSKQWNKLKSSIKTYLKDLLRLITQLTEPSVVSCVLKHIQLIVPFLICFPGIVSTFNKVSLIVYLHTKYYC